MENLFVDLLGSIFSPVTNAMAASRSKKTYMREYLPLEEIIFESKTEVEKFAKRQLDLIKNNDYMKGQSARFDHLLIRDEEITELRHGKYKHSYAEYISAHGSRLAQFMLEEACYLLHVPRKRYSKAFDWSEEQEEIGIEIIFRNLKHHNLTRDGILEVNVIKILGEIDKDKSSENLNKFFNILLTNDELKNCNREAYRKIFVDILKKSPELLSVFVDHISKSSVASYSKFSAFYDLLTDPEGFASKVPEIFDFCEEIVNHLGAIRLDDFIIENLFTNLASYGDFNFHSNKVKNLVLKTERIPESFWHYKKCRLDKSSHQIHAQDYNSISVCFFLLEKMLENKTGGINSPAFKNSVEANESIISYIGRTSPFFEVKLHVIKLCSDFIDRDPGLIDTACSIIGSINDAHQVKQIYNFIINRTDQNPDHFNKIGLKILPKIAVQSPEKASMVISALCDFVQSEFSYAEESVFFKDWAAKNIQNAQKLVSGIEGTQALQALQNWIRSGYLVGMDFSTFTPIAAENLHNAYTQLIDNGKLSGELLSNSYAVLGKISYEHPKYRKDTFQVSKEKLQNRMPDPYQINLGALSAVHTLGLTKDYSLQSFDVMAQLINDDIDAFIMVLESITSVVEFMPSLHTKAVSIFDYFLHENTTLNDDDSQDIISLLTKIGLINEEAALDVVDLLEKYIPRYTSSVKYAMSVILQKYPLFKSKIDNMDFENLDIPELY